MSCHLRLSISKLAEKQTSSMLGGQKSTRQPPNARGIAGSSDAVGAHSSPSSWRRWRRWQSQAAEADSGCDMSFQAWRPGDIHVQVVTKQCLFPKVETLFAKYTLNKL